MIREWIMKTLVKTALAMTTVSGISVQQFILMALSVIAMDTYRGDPSRDHTPTTRSNHQHLRLRLQHSGGHGWGGLLPCEHNKSLDWQDRRLQFRLINVRRTRTKWLEMQSGGRLWARVKGIYSTLACDFTFVQQLTSDSSEYQGYVDVSSSL